MTNLECRHTDRRRRGFLTGLAVLASGIAVIPLPARSAAGRPIVQPGKPTHEAFVERALQMRQAAIDRGDQPYGAVVVRDGRILGESWSRVLIDGDPTAHAEMSAIRDAAARGHGDLSGAILYSSSHPCSMCEAAAAWVGIASMRHGRSAVDAGRPASC